MYQTTRHKRHEFHALGLITRKCAICGKEFDARKEYVYKKETKNKTIKWYCSYSCYRKAEKNDKSKKNVKKNEERAG